MTDSNPPEFDYNAPFNVTFTLANATATDWIAIFESGACTTSSCDNTYDLVMWLYACGDQSCDYKVSEGLLTFGPGDPDEEGTQSWPLNSSSYEVVLLAEDGYGILAGPTYCSVCDETTPRLCSQYSLRARRGAA